MRDSQGGQKTAFEIFMLAASLWMPFEQRVVKNNKLKGKWKEEEIFGKRTAEVGVLKKNRQLMIGKVLSRHKVLVNYMDLLSKATSALSAGAFRLYNLFLCQYLPTFVLSVSSYLFFFIRVFLLFFFCQYLPTKLIL